MARPKAVIACLIAGVSFLAAQESRPADPKLSIAMQQALDRIAKGQPGVVDAGAGRPIDVRELDLRSHPMPQLERLPNQPAANVCSVPLLEMRIDHPERFTMKSVAPPTTGDRMPQAIVPAPACEKDSH